MSKTAILVVAEGSEEMETVITSDILRRAGVLVTIACIGNDSFIKCAHGVKLGTDANLANAVQGTSYDAVVLPGGPGWKNLAASAEVGSLLKDQESRNGVIAAICAAPVVLKSHGIALGKEVTSVPLHKDKLTSDYKYVEGQQVVTDGNLITSRGPATTFAFGLTIAEKLVGKEAALKVAAATLYEGYN
ncbi:protein dj-1beta-like [Belonocnema kinseyi]|uniref:protein dj-1beta-like n=1 Tax=Belonocnema kinseyi TaxID=2817044 RepID=UPI00143CC8A0|nr:protein dj-1beta-like [Belonocnema kinseyi]